MPGALEVSELGDGVRGLTVSHPARKNALDDGLLGQLEAALLDDAGVRCWLVRGAGGGVFSSGYDLQNLTQYGPDDRLPDERLGDVLDRLMHHPAPSVALVQGPAIGAGCELSMACDFRVGGPRASFGLPPAKLGVVYATRGLARVIERVGEGHARYLFLTGRRVEADEALRRGLLDVLVAEDALVEAEALALCRELAAHAPLALAGLKRGFELLARGGGTAEEQAAQEQRRRASFNSDDAREGRAAILEKRAPRFTGR